MTTDGPSWRLLAETLPPETFSEGRVGPFQLGHRLRHTPFGELRLARHIAMPAVLEVELYRDLQDDEAVQSPASPLMEDLAVVVGLAHPNVGTAVGAGLCERGPYVVRQHRLGCPLSELIGLGVDLATIRGAVLHGVARALSFLAQEGPRPNGCALGGFEPADVYLTFDGGVLLTGLGLKRARGRVDDAALADLEALATLAARIDPELSTPLTAVASAADAERVVRRARRALLPGEAEVARLLRQTFPERLLEERVYFGLPALH